MKASTIAAIIVSVLVGVFSIAYYFEFVVPGREIAVKCFGYKPDWMVFLDCHGVITITDGWDMDYISLRDHIHKYEVARVYSLDQYKIVGELLYVINRKTIQGSSSNGVRTLYYQRLFQNGNIIEYSYSNVSEIPTYIVINYKSGDARAYKSIDQAPGDEKSVFSELEKIPNKH